MQLPEWQRRAACADADPLLFDADSPFGARLCAGCPVTRECFEFGCGEYYATGVYGGRVINDGHVLRTQTTRDLDVNWSLRRMHAAYAAGARTSVVVVGEQEYQRRRNRTERRAS